MILKFHIFHQQKNLHMQKKKTSFQKFLFFNFYDIKCAELYIEKSSVLTIFPDEMFFYLFSVQIKNFKIFHHQKNLHMKKMKIFKS